VESEESPVRSRGDASAPALDWGYLASLGTAPRWTLETDRGTVVVQLDPEEAPLTVQTIAKLSEEGRFDGVPFHRVVPNFVAQGGDFASGDGFGGPGFTIKSEFTQVPYLRGSVGMASAGKDTEGSQFFFTHSMQPHLDGSYTNFGWVLGGMDVVDQLDVGDRILRASVERGG
jgi:peptidylprolyl isomerase